MPSLLIALAFWLRDMIADRRWISPLAHLGQSAGHPHDDMPGV